MHATRTVAAALALLLAAAPTLAQQQRVYQWKDAKGVTHYADLPPTQAHKSRDIDNKGNTPEIATVKPVENEQCANSRSNLTRLQTNQAVGVDTNGDGKSDRNLSSDERASQIELNQAAIKAYCPAAKP
ncbi:DUF4124 domain-containing protein [Thermomonas carbonis]|uniref:DUF4124 domain-containing protein n=1 Tax=Thermomonas carbonis TaxID=1463158 RepID=A0A7G9SU96_9GAMM|nr:DUF4124 domain-containing protein [Thermomonas carbonis]QNN71421.1 DUF4124 domain-containing protein [Thermomonas carbonis]GHC09688.1 hypothetical protein GCM10010080_26260 [Thermomonas carbonis]